MNCEIIITDPKTLELISQEPHRNNYEIDLKKIEKLLLDTLGGRINACKLKITRTYSEGFTRFSADTLYEYTLQPGYILGGLFIKIGGQVIVTTSELASRYPTNAVSNMKI